ncbi:MAG TPA: amidohydrolase family protein [Gemmatimonadaceae bacterium]|jgi:imidazolonepropionase-like amidohydrolase
MNRLTTYALLTLAIAAPARAQTIAITGGTVYPVSGPAIQNGTVVMRDGRIVAVGANVSVPSDAQRIDATGKIVTPGIVNAATQLTITEVGAVASTRNSSARGHEGIAAAFTVWDGLNPLSVLLPPARAAGITSVVIAPRGGIIAGQAAVLHLVDGSAAEMVMRSPVAMVGQISNGQQVGAQSRGEVMLRLREVLDDARTYARRKADYERAQTRQFAASRADLEALIPVLEGRVPLMLDVDQASEIESALKLARDYNLKLIISGGDEAWMVADKLAAAKVPVLTGAMNNIPMTFSRLGTRQENAGLLRRAGVAVALIGNAGGGDEEAFNVRNVRYEAGNAVAYGMSHDDALRAITLTPAEIFGVADRVGSLQPGRDADVVVWSGDPFEFATQPEHVFIRGREVRGPTRQDLLEQRYKTLPPNYRAP